MKNLAEKAAAAFESRVKRVIANGHAIDYMKCMPYIARVIHKLIMTWESLHEWLNKVGIKKATGNNSAVWMTNQLMHITQSRNRPMDSTKVWCAMNDVNIHSEKVTQDVLLLSGRNDHFAYFVTTILRQDFFPVNIKGNSVKVGDLFTLFCYPEKNNYRIE